MNWEFAIPNIEAAPAEPTAKPIMDDEAFAAFYRRSAPSLHAYLSRVSGDFALAEDLMQESYVRFLCASHPEDGEIACRRYLFRIATNLLRDHWRKPKATSIDDVSEEFFAAPLKDRTEHMESQAMLGPALLRMKPRERQLLWLAHAEDYSHREIAEITGLSFASIRILLFRARRKISKLIRQQSLVRGGVR